MIDNLILGFSESLSWANLLWCFAGAIIGTFVGVVPGLGPLAAISMLLPFTYTMVDPIGAIIMMAGIYYGSQYGGSTTAILLKLPGETSSVVSTIDGYELAKKGYAGAALTVVALGSFVAGTFATIVIALFSPEMIKLALVFTPREYFSLIFFGVVCACVMTQQHVIKGLLLVMFGLLLSTIGTDTGSGEIRNIFGTWNLASGLPFIPLCMGLYGIGEILYNVFHENKENNKLIEQVKLFSKKTLTKIKEAKNAILRGTLLGTVLGVIPGGGAILSSFLSYTLEKRIAKDKSQFGKGDIKGLAGPESANNAGAQTSFIPMLSLGLPVNPVMALMMATMVVHDIQPGPTVMTNNPKLFWGLITSMWIGNLMLIIINLSTVKLFVSFFKIKRWIIYSLVMFSCMYGSYVIGHNIFDLYILIIFGAIGYFLKYNKIDCSPLLLGFILGPKLEETLRQTLQLNNGNFLGFFDSGIALFFYLLTIILILFFSNKKSSIKSTRISR